MTAASGWGDRQETTSVSIATGSTGDTVLFTPTTSASWVVYSFRLQNTHASNATSFFFKSATTTRTGTFELAAGAVASEGQPPYPLIVGGTRNENLRINKTGSGTLEGWVTYGEAENL